MDTVALLQRLVRLNSVNPLLEGGGPGERDMVDALLERLAGLPLEMRVLEETPGRPTLVATLRGTGGGRSLLFNAHTDTVGIAGMTEDPFSGRIVDGRLYGRGSYDMKGGLAAAVEAVAALAAGPRLRGDVVLAAVADEEFGSLGTEELLRHVRTDAAIVTEPTALDLCSAHKGFAWVEITVEGRAAHGSRPDLGIDANLAMGAVLANLAALARDLGTRPAHPLLGRASLHCATLRGGTAWSTYAAQCTLQVERRLLPGETGPEAFEEIARAAAPHAARLVFWREPFETSAGTPFARVVAEAVHKVRGVKPAITGQTPWFDAALLAAAGIETIILGSGGAGAHEAVEWADTASLDTLAQSLVEVANQWCV
jgi:acetylornithine deacetylase